jgi:hypothetical protein
VFTRAGGVWTQQGPKLVGTGAVGNAAQGISVSLSDDGNTAILGGPNDDAHAGAAWVFTRAGGVWTQQGPKLVGTGALGAYGGQGFSVSLSGDGNTTIVGGPSDNFQPATGGKGAAWVFTRTDGAWSQQAKLVGTGASGLIGAEQGVSVSLSAHGNTAMLGGHRDDNDVGAGWVFTRAGGVWSQLGSKLVGSDAIGRTLEGTSVALSGDGNTAIVGGPIDNTDIGAAWVFAQPEFAGMPGKATVSARVSRRWPGSMAGSTALPRHRGSPASRHCKMLSGRFAEDSNFNSVYFTVPRKAATV